MRNLRNKNEPPVGLVEKFIGSAYDTVKVVADNIADVIRLAGLLDEGADLVTTVEMEQAIQDAIDPLYRHAGGYDASQNIPDLTSQPSTVQQGETYTVTVAGNTFFGVTLEAGDLLICNVDAADGLEDWTYVQRNLTEAEFATLAQGLLADTAVQPEDLGTAAASNVEDFATAAQGATADTALQPGDNVSNLVNDAGYTGDQTPAQIEAAYNTQVPVATQIEAEAGTATVIRRWTPERIGQAIAALADSGGAVTLDDLTDVNAGSPTDGFVLAWNNTAGAWSPADVAGGATTLGGLLDVNIVDPEDGGILAYNLANDEWEAVVLADGGGDPTTGYVVTRNLTGNYTLVLDDAGAMLDCDSTSGDIVITLPTNASVALPIGTRIDIYHRVGDTWNVQVQGAVGVTVTGLGSPDFFSKGPRYALSLWKRGDNDWVVWGSAGG